MTLEIKELLKEYTPEERKRYMKAWLRGFATELPDIAEEIPEELSETLAKLKPEQRLAGITPEERLAGITPEERLAGITPEERLAGITPEERQQLLDLLTNKDKKAD
jgi:hypothetical protein